MARRSSDREAIEAEIDRVRSLGLDQLRSLWRTTFRSSPPLAFAKDLTARFICWHIPRAITGTTWNGPRFFGLRTTVNCSEDIEGENHAGIADAHRSRRHGGNVSLLPRKVQR